MSAARTPVAISAALLGMAASTLLQTLLATATPTIVGEFGRPGLYPWVAGSYLITSVLVIPIASPVTDRIGPRPTFVVGMGLFLLGTIAVSLSDSMFSLIAARSVQGVGAGVLVPAAMSIIGMLPRSARGKAFGLVGIVQVTANLLGPLVGGWFTDGPGWRWGVLVAAPLSLAGLVVALFTMPQVEQRPENWWRVVPGDLVPNVRDRRLYLLVGMAFLVGGLLVSATNLVPWVLEGLFGASATSIGVLLLPMLIASAVGSAVGGQFAERAWCLPAAWGTMLVGLPVALLGSSWQVSLASAAIGLGCGAALPAVLTRVQALAPEGQMATTSSFVQLGRYAGAAVMMPVLGAWTSASPTFGALGLLISYAALALIGLVLSRGIQ